MNCDVLPNTGADGPLGTLIAIGIACLIVGTILLVSRSRRSGAVAVLSLLVLVGAGLGLASAAPAQAQRGCDTDDNSLTITQTSVMVGLAPGIAPVAITGLVVNNGADRTYIAEVGVEITSVTTESGSAAGSCDASDYLLLGTPMSVERALAPAGSTTFAGASIGLSNKLTNQDACQHAIVHLLYTANPD